MEESIYQDKFVASLFDRMSPSYRFMNNITSLGFYPFWRKQAINAIRIEEGDQVADLLTGPGECWKHILPKIGPAGKLTALDFSPGMLKLADEKRSTYPQYRIELLQENILSSSIPSNSQDVVICCFGLKTFHTNQLENLTAEIQRILKPGGHYSLVEVAMPKSNFLKHCYRLYLGKFIPLLSKILAKNPETYDLLEVYSNRFDGFGNIEQYFRSKGSEPQMKDLFFGCAKRITGMKL